MTFPLTHPAFTTDGRVLATPKAAHVAPAYVWSDLDLRVQGYIEAMYEALYGPNPNRFMPRPPGFEHLDPDSLDAIIRVCRTFDRSEAWKRFRAGDDTVAHMAREPSAHELNQVGRAIWHGRRRETSIGFDDGGWPWSLQAEARSYGPASVSLGQDGKVRHVTQAARMYA